VGGRIAGSEGAIVKSRSNKHYTREFKEQAMDLVRVQGTDPAKASRDLDIPPSTLRKWLDQAGWVRRVEPSSPLPEDPHALKLRVAELERQVRRLETEKEILKKATAFFASQSP
jgi:transposase